MNTNATSTLAHDDDPAGASDPDEPESSAEPEQPPDVEDAGRAIDVVAGDETIAVRVDLGWIRDRLAAAVEHIDVDVERLTVRVIGDAEMASLHGQFGGEAEPTDVLTFPAMASGAPIDADIAVCADVAVRRAASLGHRPERELLLYALHGVLHCCGFNDHDDADFRAMHAEEDRILEAIGVGATFASRGDAMNDEGGARS